MCMISKPVKSLLNLHLQEFTKHKNKKWQRKIAKQNIVAQGSKNTIADKEILISKKKQHLLFNVTVLHIKVS